MDIAAICGTAESSIRNWHDRYETFPRRNKNGEYCIRDCVEWYLVNKAGVEHKRGLLMKLAKILKIAISGGSDKPGRSDIPIEDAVPEKSSGELSYKQHVEILELRTKEAAYQLKYGDAVRMRHIVPALAALAQKIKQWASGVEKTTGHPIVNIIDQAVEQAISEMSQHTGGGDGHATA